MEIAPCAGTPLALQDIEASEPAGLDSKELLTLSERTRKLDEAVAELSLAQKGLQDWQTNFVPPPSE